MSRFKQYMDIIQEMMINENFNNSFIDYTPEIIKNKENWGDIKNFKIIKLKFNDKEYQININKGIFDDFIKNGKRISSKDYIVYKTENNESKRIMLTTYTGIEDIMSNIENFDK